MPYIVVFVYTRKAGGYEGVRTWTSFKSKQDFDKFYTPDIRERESVVKEGVTKEEAVVLCQLTPIVCRKAAALQDATDPKTGEVNIEILRTKLFMVLIATSG